MERRNPEGGVDGTRRGFGGDGCGQGSRPTVVTYRAAAQSFIIKD